MPRHFERPPSCCKLFLTVICVKMENRLHVARLLLQHGAPVNFQDSVGTTPLAAAARRGHSPMVEMLLDYGADADLYDRLGYSAYALALMSKCQRTIALLSHLHHRFVTHTHICFGTTARTHTFTLALAPESHSPLNAQCCEGVCH